MKRLMIVLTVFIIGACSANAQRSEIGIFGGGSFYMGDLNPNKPFALTKPAGGIVYRYNINPRWAFKLNAIYGLIEGDDAKVKHNELRNLSFQSHVTDIGGQIELNFFPYVTGHMKYYFSPYIFAGISVFNFKPQAVYEGETYDLQPLGTEGQGASRYPERDPYALTSAAIPFGLGLKYSIGKSICLGLEWSWRKTFTDYLDDVSTTYADPTVLAAENTPIAAVLADRTLRAPGEVIDNTDLQRGNSQNKDWYSFVGLTFTFKLKGAKTRTCSAYGDRNKFYKDYLYK